MIRKMPSGTFNPGGSQKKFNSFLSHAVNLFNEWGNRRFNLLLLMRRYVSISNGSIKLHDDAKAGLLLLIALTVPLMI
jgi:hypothetical protein